MKDDFLIKVDPSKNISKALQMPFYDIQDESKMKLAKEKYEVSKETLEVVLKVLRENWFRCDSDGEEVDNDDAIEAHYLLSAELNNIEGMK